MTIERVGVVGAGQMGAGIAEVAARAGLDVVAVDTTDDAITLGRDRVETSLSRALRSGRISEEDKATALGHLTFSTDLKDLGDRDLVIEAIVESAEAKTSLFRDLDRIAGDGAVLASNTSSIPIVNLAVATTRPDRVVGLHFFNPVPVLRLVEVVPSLLTSSETTTAVARFATERLGKVAIRAQDRAGFVVNALLVPYILSAVRMLESGFAAAEDIDLGMVEGCAHPMGPLHLADLIGLDTLLAITRSMYAEFHEPLHAAPPLLRRMVDAGLLGRKSGRGFFDYRGRGRA